MNPTAAIILAAGKGTRMQTEKPKQFMDVGGKPMVIRSIEAFLPLTDFMVVVTGDEDIPYLTELLLGNGFTAYGEGYLRDNVPVFITAGGKERYDSSIEGLQVLKSIQEDCKIPPEVFDETIVLIHDAARCLITEKEIRDCIETVRQYGSGITAVPCKDTIKTVQDGVIQNTPDRRSLYTVQTPQGFRYGKILAAYQRAITENGLSFVTDDASVLERFSEEAVHIFPGSYENLKITTGEDLISAEQILKNRE